MALSRQQACPTRVPAGSGKIRPTRLTARAINTQQQRHLDTADCSTSCEAPQQTRPAALGLAAAFAAAAIATSPPLPVSALEAAVAPAAADAPYLLSTGAKGPLAFEEARLVQLRKDLEAQVGASSVLQQLRSRCVWPWDPPAWPIGAPTPGRCPAPPAACVPGVPIGGRGACCAAGLGSGRAGCDLRGLDWRCCLHAAGQSARRQSAFTHRINPYGKQPPC